MLRNASILVLGLLLAACRFDLPSGGSGAGSGATTGTGGAPAAHACDDKKDCRTCQSCAISGECAQLATLCSKNSACVGIDQCVTGCGANIECQDQCFLNGPQGQTAFRALQQCMYCDACGSDCAGYISCN